MHCHQCGSENPDGARFCGNCGVGLDAGQPHPHEAGPSIAGRPGAGDIPPRDLGQLISATFAVYRRAALPLFIIALVPQVPNIFNLQQEPMLSLVLTIAATLLSIAAGAAGVFCVGHALTGRSTDVLDCYGRAVNVFLPMLGVVVIVTLALVGSAILMLIVIGIPLFFFLLVIWSFATHAVVIENKGVFAALGRSRELVRGNWWRVFGIGLVFVLITIALVVPVIVLSIIVELLFNPSLLVFNIISAVTAALLVPLWQVVGTLLYIDLRVRKEGYGLQSLADDLSRRPGDAR